MEPQLAEDAGDVIADRTLGDPEVGGDLAVGEAPGDEERYLLLTSGELEHRFAGQWFFFGCGDRGRSGLLGEGVLYGLFGRHRLALGPRLLEGRLSQPVTCPGKAALVSHH